MAKKTETAVKADKKETKVPVKAEKKEKKALTLSELRVELQKVVLQVRSGEESDTSKIKKLRREIARNLTKANQK